MGKRGPQPGSATKAATAAKKAKAVPAAPKAQGTTTKRTPTGAFDPAAGKDTYEPEAVVAERLSKGVTQYQVKWVGSDIGRETVEHALGAQCHSLHGDRRARTSVALAFIALASRVRAPPASHS